MGESLSLLKDGTHGSYESVQQGAWLLSAKNIINNRVVITSNDRKISENDFKKIHDKFQLRKGDVLLTIVGTIGRSAILKEANKLTFQRSVAYLRPDENILTSSDFLFSLSKSSNFQNQLKKRTVISAQPGIYLSDIDKLNITIPEIKKEQDKIASIIITIDNILSLQQRKLEQLKQLKKAMLQQLFVDKNSKQPNLRFKNFNSDWKQRKLKNISKRILRKNSDLQSLLPLTISAQDGLVDQTLYFNKQVASKQLKNYLLLYNGDFAYNKSYSVGYPYGAIKRLDKYKQGVLSTLYIAFKPTNINSDFLQHYYDTDKWYREIYRNAAEGARNHGLLNISANDFFNSKLVTPSDNEEQLKIAKIINLFNHLITLRQDNLTQLTTLKKYLLQKLFI
ncbi:restriction endonuclease subunit S [Limosilactobacillus reuteri]|uniref:restriction endonuclease subunit S n=1 Tax=Limosilactobacillus reuteri TaxID=1598 RepID=UPI003D08EC46